MKSQKDKILELMLDRFPGWLLNTEMNRDVCFRYGARLLDLKKEGWEIENEPVPNTRRQVWRCRLLKPYNEKNITKTKTENRMRDDSHEEKAEETSQMHLLQPTSDHLPSFHSPGQKQLFEM
jgi:hypothetical protein